MQNTPVEQYIIEDRNVSPLMNYLREIVYGGLDGIVTTFAIVAGFAGANLGGDVASYSFLTVLLFGLANLFADSTSMGLGNFLSIRAEKDVYKKRKKDERFKIENSSEQEQAETEYLLGQKGFSKQQAQVLTKIFMQNHDYWLDWMMQHELELPNAEDAKPLKTAIATFAAFVTFGFLPLVPFILLSNNLTTAFALSSSTTFLAFLLLGFLRWRVIKDSLRRSLFEVVLIGSISASIAFVVGLLFRNL